MAKKYSRKKISSAELKKLVLEQSRIIAQQKKEIEQFKKEQSRIIAQQKKEIAKVPIEKIKPPLPPKVQKRIPEKAKIEKQVIKKEVSAPPVPRHLPYRKEEPSKELLVKYFKLLAKRNFEKTKTFKNFNKKILKKTDVQYAGRIKKFYEQQYNLKRQSAKDVMAQIHRLFIRNTRKRFYKTNKIYWGKSAWRQDKKGKWHPPHPVKRKMWRDRLTGRYIKGKPIGLALLKAMEPDLIRRYMQLHKIKNYQKGRSKYLKATKNLSVGKIIELYGTSP